jgi:glycosyltransferase involved in cell wall biosynthesis
MSYYNLQKPTITVVMPTYNAGNYLRSAVLSVVLQSFKDWELLLIDDGSTDNSIATISNIKDKRIKIIKEKKNIGIIKTMNKAIKIARGTFLARMDADDICHPKRFAKQVEFLKNNSHIDLVATDCIVISENDKILGHLSFSSNYINLISRPWISIDMPHPTWLGKTSWFRHHGYSKSFFLDKKMIEDQELLLRSHETSQFYVMPYYLFAYRTKNHINLKKIFSKRFFLFVVHIKYFLKKKKYFNLILATFRFLLGLLITILEKLKLCPIKFTKIKDDVSSEDLIYWKSWVNELRKK